MAYNPTNGFGSSSVQKLRENGGRFAKEFVLDKKIDYLFVLPNFQDGTPADCLSMGAGTADLNIGALAA